MIGVNFIQLKVPNNKEQYMNNEYARDTQLVASNLAKYQIKEHLKTAFVCIKS